MDILESTDHSTEDFVQISEITRHCRLSSYACICVYMNISQPLPESIEIECQDEIWSQPLDYKHVPFKCRFYHDYGHLFRDFLDQATTLR